MRPRLILCTPDGRVSRYLGGVVYNPQTLRLSLVEASEGKVGSTLDQFFLSCFHYDEKAGRYGPFALGIMRIGGVLTLLALGGVLAFFWIREGRREEQGQRRRKRRDVAALSAVDRRLALHALLAQIEESFWLPPPASTTSAIVDNLFYILLGVSIFFFTLIIVLMTIFVILFRRREGVEPSPSPSHNTALELIWTAIPILIVSFIFYEGVTGFMRDADRAAPGLRDRRGGPAMAVDVRVPQRAQGRAVARAGRSSRSGW